MIEGIIADNFIDLIIGVIAIWFFTAVSKKWIGGVIAALYVMSLAGQAMNAEYVTVGFVVHILAFCIGGVIAFIIRKIKTRKVA